jgi:putative membrane protein
VIPARAHDVSAPAQTFGWTFEPWVVLSLGLALILYLLGAVRLHARMRNARGVLARRTVYFLLGWLALVVALVSPLDALGTQTFAAHMVQHEVLMIVAAPLLVLSKPLGAWIWSVPAGARDAIGTGIKTGPVQVLWQAITRPVSAWLIHAAALWLWHAPPFFQAALRNNTVHAWQHASFLFSALLFWWAVLGDIGVRPARGASIAYLFTTMMHTGALGALLAMSDKVWYPLYGDRSPEFGLSALEDQQLGGLIMWVPGGLAYVIAGLVLCAGWLVQRERAVARPQLVAGPPVGGQA